MDYGNLRVSGGGDKTLLGDVGVRGVLELSGARVVLAQRDLTLKLGASLIAGQPFSSSNMLVTEAGSFIREGAASGDFLGIYPVGSGGAYAPFQIDNFQVTGSGSISVRTTPGNAPGSNPTDLQRHWITSVAGVSVQDASVRFTYANGELPNTVSYEPKVFQNGSWIDIPGGQNYGANTFGGSGISDLNGIWTLREPVITYYSYQSGSWDNPNTWTTDPSEPYLLMPGSLCPRKSSNS